MSTAGFKLEPEKGCDATHRAKYFRPHLSDLSMAGNRRFRGGRCARSFGSVLETRAFAPFRERAHGALRAARP